MPTIIHLKLSQQEGDPRIERHNLETNLMIEGFQEVDHNWSKMSDFCHELGHWKKDCPKLVGDKKLDANVV